MGDHLTPHEYMLDTFALLNAGDVEGCLARMSDDFTMYLAGAPEPMVGKAAWRANYEYLLSAFPDVSVRADEAFSSEDRAVCLVTLSGSHQGEFLGVEPTGRSVSFASYEIYRVVDGVIVEERILTDLHSLLTQLS